MEMRNNKKNVRKVKRQQFAEPTLFLSSRSVLKTLAGDATVKEYNNVERSFMNNHFRYPHRVQRNVTPEHIIQEQSMVRKITVDLRPILREAIDLREEDASDIENPSSSVSAAARSGRGSNREFHSHSASRRLSEQDLHSEESSISTSGLSEQGWNRRFVNLEKASPIQRRSEAISFSFPSLQNCEICEEKPKPALKSQKRVNLVEITNTGTLTSDKEQQFIASPPVSFPKIILKESPSLKTSKDPRILPNENTSWPDLEKLQLPISELVRVIKEQTSSEQHTLIAKVLSSLREKQGKDALQHVGGSERMYQETSQKMPQIPGAGGEIRLTWIKRS